MSKRTGGIEETLVNSKPSEAGAQMRNWQDLLPGCVVPEAGSGQAYQTGDWRSQRPVINLDQCIHCFFCWVFCPDASIKTENKKVVGVDYYHCKGCGICAYECPKKCIEMIDEEAALKQEAVASAQKKESGS